MTEEENQPVGPTELETLKDRAKLMGIKFHPNIGVKKLRGMVNARLDNETDPDEDEDETEELVVVAKPKKATKGAPRAETEAEAKIRAKNEQNIKRKAAHSLVRIRLACMNPAKADWDGEIITVQNRVMGTIRKYIPFNAENGYHVPQMLLNVLRTKQCQTFHTVTRGGVKVRQGKLVPEFAIEVLPMLTQKEIDQIATRQAAQGVMDD
jgi:hypothetical protein